MAAEAVEAQVEPVAEEVEIGTIMERFGKIDYSPGRWAMIRKAIDVLKGKNEEQCSKRMQYSLKM